MAAEEPAVMTPGPHGDEVPYSELKEGHDYYITKWGTRGENWGKAKGINLITKDEVYNGNPNTYTEDGKEKRRYLGLGGDNVHEGDPLVKFEKVVEVIPKQLTHLKPYNEGRKQGVGYKFHNVDTIEHIAPLALKDKELPDEVKDYIGTFGGKRNKKKRRKTRRTRKGTRKRNKPRKTRRKRNRH